MLLIKLLSHSSRMVTDYLPITRHTSEERELFDVGEICSSYYYYLKHDNTKIKGPCSTCVFVAR